MQSQSVCAAYSLTTGIGTGADEDVREQTPTDASGGRAFLELRSRAIAGTERHIPAFFRFDFTGVTGPINAVSLKFWIASSTVDSDSFTIDVYGVVDGVAGESDWSASTLSYNNAPGLGAADYPAIDRDLAAGEYVYLGAVTYAGGSKSGGLTFTNQALLDFINADTNHAVTLFLEPQVAATGQDFFVHVRTFEGVGSDAGDFAPTLDLPNVAPPGTSLPPPTDAVFLNETTGDVTVGNGIVRALIGKSDGVCSDLRKEGGANTLLNGGKLYFDSNSGGAFYSFGGTYALVEKTTQRVHIKFSGRMGEFTTELHYVLEVGDSGLHCYTVFRHGAGDAATYLEQARMVLRCDKNVFTHAFTSETKSGQMVAPSLLASAPVIMDATNQLPASSSYTTPTGLTDTGLPVYTKYDWADFLETHKAHGLAGDSTGLWMISGSEEFMNGGPTKGELFVHGTETTPLMIETFHAAHFLGSDSNLQMAADEVWQKVYGPYFVYVNTGVGAQALWQDALVRATAEKAAWPLSWMNEPAYPVARGTVTGRVLAAGAAGANALMVLAQPGSDWQAQGRDYLFWTRADAAGNFTLSKVRPGTYSLYACVPGFSGQMELGQVAVGASATTDLGRLSWTPPRRAQTLWQIGTPDRSTAEFRFGDRMRQFGLWWRYLEEKGTADLNYTIGVSSPADWYYAQSVMALDDGTYLTPKWNVIFPLAAIPAGPAELVIDFAGAMSSTLNLTLNGTSIGSLAMVNDAGIYRSATSLSRYTQQRVSISTALLRTGSNTLTFQLSGRSNWSGTKPVSPASGVMYDAIRLEAGAATIESQLRDYALTVSAGTGGTVSGGGYFAVGTTTEVRATASPGYRFVAWSDGSTAALRSVTVASAATYAATFSASSLGVFDQWAMTTLSAGDRDFAGDADGNGIANGIEFAYSLPAGATALMEVRVIGGNPTAVLSATPTSNGTAYTSLEVQATTDLLDWTAGAVVLTETQVAGERRWSPAAPGAKTYFRAVVRLIP